MSEKLTTEAIEFLMKQINKTQYGTVKIEIRETFDHIDIITEERQRFPKPKK